MFKGCDHIRAVVQVAQWNPLIGFSAVQGLSKRRIKSDMGCIRIRIDILGSNIEAIRFDCSRIEGLFDSTLSDQTFIRSDIYSIRLVFDPAFIRSDIYSIRLVFDPAFIRSDIYSIRLVFDPAFIRFDRDSIRCLSDSTRTRFDSILDSIRSDLGFDSK